MMPIIDNWSFRYLYAINPIIAPIGQKNIGIISGSPCIFSIEIIPKKKFKMSIDRIEGIAIETIPKMIPFLFFIKNPPFITY